MTPLEADAILVRNGFDPRFLRESRFFFLEAFKKGDLELAEAFITRGVPFAAEYDREPAIVKAAEGGRWDAVQLATKHGAPLEARDRRGETALRTAANWGHVNLVRQLATAGANVDSINRLGTTPLYGAIAADRLDVAAVLLEANADPNAGTPPSLMAAKNTRALELLLSAGANPNIVVDPISKDSLLLDRVVRRVAADVKALLEHGALDVPNAAGWTAWMAASAAGDHATATLLAKHGAATHDDWQLPLHAASTTSAVNAALAAGAALEAIDRHGATALVAACREKRGEVARRLLEAGAKAAHADLRGNTALRFAADAGDFELVARLLDAGAPANDSLGTDGKPRSWVLLHACRTGDLALVERLLAAGANPDSADKTGNTAVSFATRGQKNFDVLDALLRTPNEPDASTALLGAAPDAIAVLARAGVDLEREGPNGDTALLALCGVFSAQPHHGTRVAALLAAGADPRHANRLGNTPFDAALAANNTHALAALDAFLVTALFDRHREGPDAPIDWRGVVTEAHGEHLRAMVHRGDVESVRAMFDHGLDVTLFERGPSPVLLYAVSCPEIFDLALDRGADPRVRKGSITLLMRAAWRGIAAQVSRLIGLGLDLEAATDSGATALTEARDLDIARALIEAGANVNPVRGGWSPLMRAAQARTVEQVDYLLTAGADPNIVSSNSASALTVAQARRDGPASKAIAKRLARVTKPDIRDERGRTSLFHAAMRGDAETVRRLLARGADPTVRDRDKSTPASVGALREEIAAALGIAYQPLTPTRVAESPALFTALRRGENPPDVPSDVRSERGDTPLHIATALGDTRAITRLLDAGADVNAANAVGHTPWSVAIALHGMALAESIRKRGGKLDTSLQLATSDAYNDFRIALRAGDLCDVHRRIAAGEIDPHLIARGETPLAHAVAGGDLVMVSLLLDIGVDVHVPTWSGSILHEAVLHRHVMIAQRLLDAGARIDALAMQLAANHGDVTMMRLLAERGAPLQIDVTDMAEESLRAVIEFARGIGRTDIAARATEQLMLLLRE